jgi:hypothetical protein
LTVNLSGAPAAGSELGVSTSLVGSDALRRPVRGSEPTATAAEVRALLARKVRRSDRDGAIVSDLRCHEPAMRRTVLAP